MEGDFATTESFYSNQHGHISFHDIILRDTAVFSQFEKAIRYNSTLFKDKIVLEIGSGTGIFSMMAAKSGAKHVYAWEPSLLNIYSKKTIEDNNLQDKITILSQNLEEIKLEEKVDVIFTLCFGYGVIYESYFPQFLKAKELFLSENGITIPSKIDLIIAPQKVSQIRRQLAQYSNYWDNDVYGYNYKAMNELVDSSVNIDYLIPTSISSSPHIFKSIVTSEAKTDLSLNGNFEFTIESDQELEGFGSWFDIQFPTSTEPIIVSTAPSCENLTHFCQLAFHFQKSIDVKKDDVISGSVNISYQGDKCSPLIYDISYKINDSDPISQKYILK